MLPQGGYIFFQKTRRISNENKKNGHYQTDVSYYFSADSSGDVILGSVLTNRLQFMLLTNIRQNALNISNCAVADVDPYEMIYI